MCFYNSSTKRALELANRYGRKSDVIEIAQEIFDEQYKVTAFTHPVCPLVTSHPSMQTASWGLIPSWVKTNEDALKVRKMTLNARTETVFNLPSFRAPVLSKRCLLPSTGYFEFHHAGKEVLPYLIFLRHEEIFSIGGVYDVWQNPETNEIVQSFSVLTTPANALCAKIHNGGKNPYRMPLIISREDEEQWLDSSLKANDINRFFTPFESELMDAYPIARDFTKRNPKDSTIIEPANSNLFLFQ